MKLKLLVLALVLCVFSPCLATDKPIYGQWRYSQQEKAFDHIEKITVVQASTTNVLCATDIVSTNTAAVYYLPDTVTYPIEVEIINTTSTVINYDIYSTTAASGVNVPTTTDGALYTNDGASLVSSKSTKRVYYQKPNECYAAASPATFTVVVRSITEY